MKDLPLHPRVGGGNFEWGGWRRSYNNYNNYIIYIIYNKRSDRTVLSRGGSLIFGRIGEDPGIANVDVHRRSLLDPSAFEAVFRQVCD